MEKIFEDMASEKVFLKMDIEGSEYRCLEAIIKNQHKIVVSNRISRRRFVDKINYFITKLNLSLIHVHANNSSPITPLGIPSYLN